jgi:indolepyruvate ferredoxin oxidoreductase beta subunit
MTTKPVTILVAALGGEGGGVLADWLIDAANRHDFPVQSTSVPGVAQRTGATTYYIEIFPVTRSALAGRVPVLSLTPNPGNVDVVAASELIEAGRALQGGFVNPQRTTLIASVHREYAVSEKVAMGDGRYDAGKVLAAAGQMAQTALLFDMRQLALQHGTVINTVMFGAMVGAGALPLSKDSCEAAIRHAGKAVEASLKGFQAGYAYAAAGGVAQPAVLAAATASAVADRGAGTPAMGGTQRRLAALPAPVRELVGTGVRQVVDYQDAAYAELYLDRVEAVCALERAAGGGPAGFALTRETARFLALWMSYEDVIRVADLKTRRERLGRVRREVGAKADEPVLLTEYLKPGMDELCSLMPTALAGKLRAYFGKRGKPMNVGLHIRTSSVAGFAMLAGLRSLRRWRRLTSRYHSEQALIERWLAAVQDAAAESLELALELAACGNLVKGYGETSERGHRNLKAILADAGQPSGTLSATERALRVRTARAAALDDPEGRKLASSLGLAMPEIKAKPLRFVPRHSISASTDK